MKFSLIENTVFFLSKKLMEKLYSLITEKFLFWTFWRWEMRSFLSQSIDRKMIFTDYWKFFVLNFSLIENTVFFLRQKLHGNMIFTENWKVLILNFSVMGNTVIFSSKMLMERWYLLGLLSFQDIPRTGKYGFSCSASATEYSIKISICKIHDNVM